ncbi:MAG TPA: hypothetical protein VM661_00500 [Candidatus Sulfotelmatobacter sp.]|jgi:hypothetical protein|nr:hypothetical protein [Candidatus Sulfotelmatobacter sp.]
MTTTEVYSCKPGQQLKEGRLDFAPEVETKDQADADARRRCKIDPALAKVAYYRVEEDGRFRMLHVYANPRPSTPVLVRRSMAQSDFKPRAGSAKPYPQPTLLQRLIRLFRPDKR